MKTNKLQKYGKNNIKTKDIDLIIFTEITLWYNIKDQIHNLDTQPPKGFIYIEQ